jgi:glycolate oxidase iron-sulfur subunit
VTQRARGPADALAAEQAGLLACVHCGFCLNACPTYTRLGHEGDSPRGRLDLMRAVVEGRLEPDDPAFRLHIDRCLGCRACEPVCPSGVPYGFLLERARDDIAAAVGVSLPNRLLIAAYTGRASGLVTLLSRAIRASRLPRLLAPLLPAGAGFPRFGMAMLAASARWPGLRRAPGGSAPSHVAPADIARADKASAPRGPAPPDVALPAGSPAADAADAADVAADTAADPRRAHADPHALAGAFPIATGAAPGAATGPAQGAATAAVDAGPGATGSAIAARIRGRTAQGAGTGAPPLRAALLRGCVQQSLFARVNDATVRVLEANGCAVVEVTKRRSSVALDAHAGRLERALELARSNIAAFEASGADIYVVNAAGCGAMMKEYAEQLHHDPEWAERAAAFSARVRDAAELLAERGVRPGGRVELRITCDAPCHLLHAQRIRDAPQSLLDAIPGVERVPLPRADECCGGAGLYGVNHPELGGRILQDKCDAIRSTGAAAVATPNPGCMMQIGAGLLLDGQDVAVVHPIEVLDESYRREREAE